MEKVKVEYVGPKNKIGLLLPIGEKRRTASIGAITFLKGQPVELTALEAEALCRADRNFKVVLTDKDLAPVTLKVEPKPRVQRRVASTEAEDQAFLEKLMG